MGEHDSTQSFCTKCNRKLPYKRQNKTILKPLYCGKCFSEYLMSLEDLRDKARRLEADAAGMFPRFFSFEDQEWGDDCYLNCSEATV